MVVMVVLAELAVPVVLVLMPAVPAVPVVPVVLAVTKAKAGLTHSAAAGDSVVQAALAVPVEQVVLGPSGCFALAGDSALAQAPVRLVAKVLQPAPAPGLVPVLVPPLGLRSRALVPESVLGR